jgi:hypothetical protein
MDAFVVVESLSRGLVLDSDSPAYLEGETFVVGGDPEEVYVTRDGLEGAEGEDDGEFLHEAKGTFLMGMRVLSGA